MVGRPIALTVDATHVPALHRADKEKDMPTIRMTAEDIHARLILGKMFVVLEQETATGETHRSLVLHYNPDQQFRPHRTVYRKWRSIQLEPLSSKEIMLMLTVSPLIVARPVVEPSMVLETTSSREDQHGVISGKAEEVTQAIASLLLTVVDQLTFSALRIEALSPITHLRGLVAAGETPMDLQMVTMHR